MMFTWLSFFTGFAYIGFGIMVIIKKWFFIPLEDLGAYGLGGIMILYGLFRIGRSLKQLKDKK